MPFKHKIYFGLAACHLLMIALFASHFGEWGFKGKLLNTLSTTGSFTGSNNVFSFFAPSISDQPFVVYDVKDAAGKNHVLDLAGRSKDFSNRVNNIYGYLAMPEARNIVSASLAKFVMNQCPTAEKVRVAMVIQQIPTMAEYRNGQRQKWLFWFHRDFEKSRSVAVTP